jgi:hypothetical protein
MSDGLAEYVVITALPGGRTALFSFGRSRCGKRFRKGGRLEVCKPRVKQEWEKSLQNSGI